MRRILGYVLIVMMVCLFISCSESLKEPSSGLMFVIADEGQTQLDEYELNLVDEEGGFVVVTLKKDNNYQVTWNQTLVDKYEGQTFQVKVLKGYNVRESGDLEPVGPSFTLSFKEGTTSLGRVVKVKLN